MIVMKLGGAALTKKDDFETLHDENLASCAELIAAAWTNESSRCVVIHGAGSFGHFQAREHNLKAGGGYSNGVAIEATRMGLSACRLSLARLNTALLGELCRMGVPAVTIDLFPCVETDGGKAMKCMSP